MRRSCSNDSSARPAPSIVFEGNAPANLRTNARLNELLAAPDWPAPSNAPVAWLGDPVAIKEPTGVPMRRQSGSNLMVIGQQEEQAIAIIAAALVPRAAQQRPGTAGV